MAILGTLSTHIPGHTGVIQTEIGLFYTTFRQPIYVFLLYFFNILRKSAVRKKRLRFRVCDITRMSYMNVTLNCSMLKKILIKHTNLYPRISWGETQIGTYFPLVPSVSLRNCSVCP